MTVVGFLYLNTSIRHLLTMEMDVAQFVFFLFFLVLDAAFYYVYLWYVAVTRLFNIISHTYLY